MAKLRFTFPDGRYVLADLFDKEEPEICEQIDKLVENGPVKLACYHTVSTGGFFQGMPRPPKEPVSSGSQVRGIGHSGKIIYDLEPGEICWPGWNFWFSYMPNTEPVPIGGPVIAKVIPEHMDTYVEECNKVWENSYRNHVLDIIVVQKEEA